MRLAHSSHTGKKRFKMGFCNHKMTVYTKDRDVKRRFEKAGFTVEFDRAFAVDKEASRCVLSAPTGVSLVDVVAVKKMTKISDWFKPVLTI